MTIDIRGCQEQRRFNAVKSVVRFYCYEGAIRVDLITRVNCHVGNGTLGTENDPAMVPNVHVRAQSMGIDVVVRRKVCSYTEIYNWRTRTGESEGEVNELKTPVDPTPRLLLYFPCLAVCRVPVPIIFLFSFWILGPIWENFKTI